MFLCATVSIGILISTITRTQQQAMMGGFLYLLPSMLISGPIPNELVSEDAQLLFFKMVHQIHRFDQN